MTDLIERLTAAPAFALMARILLTLMFFYEGDTAFIYFQF